MRFTTQRELLEYLGKNGEDRGLVQRMMSRGEVYKEEGMYVLVNKDEEIMELKKEIKNLKEKMGSMGDLEEAKAQWEHYENLYNAEREDKQERIRRCFRWIKQIKPTADWEEFRDWVMNDEEL